MNKKKLPRHTSHRGSFTVPPLPPASSFLPPLPQEVGAIAISFLPPPLPTFLLLRKKTLFSPLLFIRSRRRRVPLGRRSVGRGKEGPSFLSAKRRRRWVLKG